MGRLIGRMTQFSMTVFVLSQVCVLALADETSAPVAAVETVVSVSNIAVVEEHVELIPIDKPRPLFQHASYPDAWKAAQESNRPILVYVSMPNCHYCVKMKEQVYLLPRVEKLVSSSFETIQAGRYTHAKLVEKLHIKWYPTTVLVGPNNKILDVIEGYSDANKFQQRLQTGLASLGNVSDTTQTR